MITLQRKVDVVTYEHQATIAVAKDRPEFLSLARLAADLGRPIDARDVQRELLGELPEQVCWRVIERAITMGLLERDDHRGPASLTESGRLMLEHGKVLVPEEGIWRFHWLEDPLVEQGLIHVERIKTENAQQARNAVYKDKGSPGRGTHSEGYTLIRRYRGHTLFSLSDHSAFEIKELASNGRDSKTYPLELTFTWAADASSPTLALRADIDDKGKRNALRVDTRLPIPKRLVNVDYLSLWAELASQSDKVALTAEALSDYCVKHGAAQPLLPTTLELWSDAERRAMSADVSLERPQLNLHWMKLELPRKSCDLGKFSPTTLKAVPLTAACDEDSTTWAQWLQWDALTCYVVPADIREQSAGISHRFPNHTPELLDTQALIDKAKANPTAPAARNLLTPYDLGLWSKQ